MLCTLAVLLDEEFAAGIPEQSIGAGRGTLRLADSLRGVSSGAPPGFLLNWAGVTSTVDSLCNHDFPQESLESLPPRHCIY